MIASTSNLKPGGPWRHRTPGCTARPRGACGPPGGGSSVSRIASLPAAPEREPFPRWIDPMLLSSGPLPPNGESWVFELKWDGMRASSPWRMGQSACSHGCVATGQQSSRSSGDIAAALGAHRQVILDGELVCLDGDGKPGLRAAARPSRRLPTERFSPAGPSDDLRRPASRRLRGPGTALCAPARTPR
jgi:hypothetical protein